MKEYTRIYYSPGHITMLNWEHNLAYNIVLFNAQLHILDEFFQVGLYLGTLYTDK